MRQIIGVTWLILLGFFVLPLLFLCPVEEVEEIAALPTATLPLDKTVVVAEEGHLDGAVEVKLLDETGAVITLTMDEYLWGVVAAEMPASFEVEALKAQAVAARTYAVSKMAGTVANHPEADICTDHNCCQAYTTPEVAQEGWGEQASVYTEKIADAVAQTDGVVIYYEDEPIEAVFHSSSSGQTVDAVAVWGTDVPYLTGVASPEGEEVPNWQSECIFSAEELKSVISDAYPQANLSGEANTWLGPVTLNSAGGVDTVEIGGVAIQGTTMRTLFGLRAACFDLTLEEGQFIFAVTGYGHGVGMSQYGANELASDDWSYEEILMWYYTGVTLCVMTE